MAAEVREVCCDDDTCDTDMQRRRGGEGDGKVKGTEGGKIKKETKKRRGKVYGREMGM